MKKLKFSFEIGILVVLVLAVIFVMQNYSQRTIQSRIRGASQFLKGAAWKSSALGTELQYEPYYLNSSYEVVIAETTSAGPSAATATIPRKLIRKAEMTLKVNDAQNALKKIIELVNSLNGIIIDSSVNQSSDEEKNGQTTFKIPPKDFETALAKLRGLGKVEYEKLSGEDVTEQYVDVQARLQNARRVRDRLLKILDERAREVKDILEVERELARVGGEIESMEGRLKYLDRQVDLATVTVSFHEKRIAILSGLNFKDEFRQTLKEALEAFVHAFNGAIVVIAALLPIAFWIGIVGAIIIGIRKNLRR